MAVHSPIKITKAGWLYIVLTIILGFAAVNTANNLIYIVASALLSFMAVSGLFGKNNLVKIDISVDFPAEVYAGRTFPVKVTLANNRNLLPAFLIRVSIERDVVLFPYVEARQKDSKYINTCFAQRGKYYISEVSISSIFPFNFFIRSKAIQSYQETIVFLEPRACTLLTKDENQSKNLGEHNSLIHGYGDDITSIREYSHGDPLKYINWKATAKTDKLKTNKFSSNQSRPVMLDITLLPLHGLEAKLSCLTYLILRLVRNNTPVGLKLSNKLMNPSTTQVHKLNMLKELALYA
jgi:uncharacterized protein (DUF58 family)